MQTAPFIRRYIMLRPVQGAGSGFVRTEGPPGRCRLTLRASCLPEGAVRALLLSGDAEGGAVLDLGLLTPVARGQAGLCRDIVSLQGGYHTLALCTDWPEGTVLMTAALRPSPCGLSQVQRAVQRHLSVPGPPGGTPLPEPPVRSRPVLTLPALQWPDSLEALRGYFGTLLPSAPFDEPGWRFVRVPLDSGGPAPFCEVGVRVEGRRITEAAYALPGQRDRPLPRSLQGYHWQAGRHGQGYWVLRHTILK